MGDQIHRLVVLEGTDGSGKATQARLLEQELAKAGIKCRRISFPRYDSQSSALVRMYLGGSFGEDPEAVNPYASSVFFSVDRYASFMTEWKEDYDSGVVIIADRYTTSNAVHQAEKLSGSGREDFLKWLFDFEYRLLKLPKPDLVVFLDMPSEKSFELMEKRQGTSGDIHEKDKQYLEKCRSNALDISRRFDWRRVDCVRGQEIRTPEDISHEVLSAVKEVLAIE